MTKATAAAIQEATESLYGCFESYRDRLRKEPRTIEERAVFDQLFNDEVRAVRPEALVPLVALFRLSTHRFGALEFKYFLPRLCEIAARPLPALGFPVLTELLGLFEFEQWLATERTAVWDYLLLFLRGLLEDFSGRKAPPWGAYGYFRELSRATEHVYPALLSWEMADFVTSLLHLATFAITWVEDEPLRERQFWGREQTAAIEQWLRTVGREKLEQAERRHGTEPFAVEFRAALAKLSGEARDSSAR